MLGPLNIRLEDYGVSPVNGFLPNELPLQRLPNAYYSVWERVIDHLSIDLKQKTIRSKVDRLPILSTSRLASEAEWQRAYVLLTFMTHAYIWGGDAPSEILPACISVPILAVASHLGIPPTATAASLCLWNFTSSSSDLTVVENLSALHTFTGTLDEEWFYMVSVAIESCGAKIIPVMLRAMDAVRANNPWLVSQCLMEFATCVHDLGTILERMHEKCTPDVFYHQIRPALAGSKNMAAAGLPRGVFYDEGNGKGEWRHYSGGSNAQSSIIQFLDVVLGITHFPTKTPGEEAKEKHSFLQSMREYMPGGHRQFLEKIQKLSNIRQYAQTSASGDEIVAAYNLAVASLGELRDKHIKIVTRFIIGPSRKPNAGKFLGINLAVASSGNKEVEGLQGSGGTQLMPFLKQSRDETKGTALVS